MYAGNNAYNVYKSNSVNFASKEQLLIMLLDGAVKFSKMAKQAMIDKDIKGAHENVIKTQNIFYELINSMDTSKSGEWVQPLLGIYDFIIRRLTDANMKKDVEIMNEVVPLIEDVRNMWDDAYKMSKAK